MKNQLRSLCNKLIFTREQIAKLQLRERELMAAIVKERALTKPVEPPPTSSPE